MHIKFLQRNRDLASPSHTNREVALASNNLKEDLRYSVFHYFNRHYPIAENKWNCVIEKYHNEDYDYSR